MLMIFWIIVILFSINYAESKEHEFNRDQTGVIFSPYVKNWNNDGSIPNWKNYTMEDVTRMLELVSTKFTHISTYGMGVGSAKEKWYDSDTIALTAVAAGELNLKNGKLTISLAEGIWHNSDPALYKQEINNAFEAAKEANTKFPKTVTGIVLSRFSWMWYGSWQDAVGFLQENREKAEKMGLKIGLRLDICGDIVPPKSQPQENTGRIPLSDIQMIARIADILICRIYPPANVAAEGTQETVRTLGKQMSAIETALKVENNGLIVTWETGWPSHGVSRFGSENSNRNLRNYWVQFDEWAKSTKSKLYMLEAFDEPWKTNPKSDKEHTDPEGPIGAESHFGWWTLRDNNDMKSFIEKEPEPGPEMKPPNPGGEISSDHGQNKTTTILNTSSNGNKFGAGIILGILTPIISILL